MGLYLKVSISFAIQSCVLSFVFGDLSKCCPLYEELSLRKNFSTGSFSIHDFNCLLSNGSTLSITHSQLRTGLPTCQQVRLVDIYDKHSMVACMDRIGQLNNVYGLACVDDFDQEQSSQRPTKRRMGEDDINSIDWRDHKNLNRTADNAGLQPTESTRQRQNSFPIAPVINVRKCCPLNRKYAAESQFCYSKFSSNDSSVLKHLPRLTIQIADRYVNFIDGTPPCHSNAVLVDTVLPFNQTNFTGEALNLRGTVYSSDEYCVDMVDDKFEYLVVRTCQDQVTQCQHNGHLCVRKCCPDGQEVDKVGCVPSKRALQLSFHNITNKHDSALLIEPIEATPAFIFGNPCKNKKFVLNPAYPGDAHVLTAAGSVFMKKSQMDLDRNSYCVDNYKSREGFKTFRCFPDTSNDEEESLKPTVTLVCMATSALCLLLTFLVYLMLPSLHNLHGKLIMCYLFTLALSYSTVVVSIILSKKALEKERKPTGICIFLGYIMQFLFLSSFSWLNIISYDIWSTFRAVRSAFLKKSNTFKRISMFCLYGWGSSFMWTAFTFICQFTSIVGENSSLKPDIGNTKCFFSPDSTGKLVFFVAPVLTMISFNVIIFIFTVKYCANIRSELKKSNNNYSLKRYSADKNELIINLKLFIVMGVNWLMELISVLVKPQSQTFFLVSDLMNALGGVFIFCIFVLKRKVLMELKAKVYGKRPKSRTFERATGFTTSTSSSIVMNFMNSRRSVSLNP